ncbi:site-specific DNA-methyltransferase [uncultured Corynebacterium sp.]|uniref:site-specific DNA-methyltransferase n=1 Tax=uncultured Corynebacterium sp. TaxID=159447 RepID=UPI0025991BA8|nr:DNA methyltransferase [uncultured Corynebacterium sp.]
MSRLNDLLAQAKVSNPALGAELEAEFKRLENRRTFGLVFERHEPEVVELYSRTPRRGDKVHVLPERGSLAKQDNRLWRVTAIQRGETTIAELLETLPGNQEWDAELIGREPENQSVAINDVVVVAEHTDPVYPGLVETGRVENGNPNDPAHTVINAENFHALEALTYTHSGKIDCIYIDPPYNTGAKDWKYNNDYVDGEDAYRHSKWLSLMERRLLVAKRLLNPDDSVLIVTIDEKEYLRLGMLLEQTFPEARIQMVSSVTNPTGSMRSTELTRTDEYIFLVQIGSCKPQPVSFSEYVDKKDEPKKVLWQGLRRRGGATWSRESRPNLFYPIFVTKDGSEFVSTGDSLPLDNQRNSVEAPPGAIAIWPLSPDGSEGRWQVNQERFEAQLKSGTAKIQPAFGSRLPTPYYLTSGNLERLEKGEIYPVYDEHKTVTHFEYKTEQRVPSTQWSIASHDARTFGTGIISQILPGRRFPFPKSLYAVEDALRFFVKDKPDATILDFFSGSGTTAHAVMRLNKQDGGRRRSISVTNNEVSADEQKRLRAQGLRPGDQEWEQWGICDYVTKPRIEAAITGKTPEGTPIKGDYKFTDEFPMSDGINANARFFTLTYENPVAIDFGRGFERIAPLLWFRAGQVGPIIDSIGDTGFEVTDHYAVLQNIDATSEFLAELEGKDSLTHVFVITNNVSAYQRIAQTLGDGIETVQLYESYLTNFQINAGRKG